MKKKVLLTKVVSLFLMVVISIAGYVSLGEMLVQYESPYEVRPANVLPPMKQQN